MNRRVYETVARKRACEGPLEPGEAELERQLGSKAWHTRGYLLHYDKPGTLQMLTFRLADAMPAGQRHEWEALCRIEDERERRTKLDLEQRERKVALGWIEPLLRGAVRPRRKPT